MITSGYEVKHDGDRDQIESDFVNFDAVGFDLDNWGAGRAVLGRDLQLIAGG